MDSTKLLYAAEHSKVQNKIFFVLFMSVIQKVTCRFQGRTTVEMCSYP